jgi:D-sedoheptulose 7-phosphate isomerase
MVEFNRYIDEVARVLKALSVTDGRGDAMAPDQGFEDWCRTTRGLQSNSRTMYFVGNGASAMMAGHMAADACKNGGIRAMAFNDAALMTAVSNDIAYEQSFAFPLRRFGQEDDVLVTISSSGNSPNVIRAIETAREIGMVVITLSGMKPDNQCRVRGDINFYVPGKTYGVVESAHQVLLHCWLDRYMQ